MSSPLDYSLCAQTVTIYRKQKNEVLRMVLDGCFYTWETVQSRNAGGLGQEVNFLLIVPSDVQTVFPGDRVYAGVGPVITPAQWAGFIPVTVPTLAQVQYVKPCFWDGSLCHVEAGRK